MLIDIAAPTLSSTACGWRETSAMVRTAQPEHWLVLYDMGAAHTSLYNGANNSWRIRVWEARVRCWGVCPYARHKPERLLKKAGHVQSPFLEDPSTGEMLFEPRHIIEYLNRPYQL